MKRITCDTKAPSRIDGVDYVYETISSSYAIPNWKFSSRSSEIADLCMDVIFRDYPKDRINDRLFTVRWLASRMCSKTPLDDCVFHYTKPMGVWYTDSKIVARDRLKGKPLKHTQCFLIAKMMVSLCLFLGISARICRVDGARIDPKMNGGIDHFPVPIIHKGSVNGRTPIPSELPCVRGMSKNSGNTWDQHAIVQVLVNDEWWIVDPTPIVGISITNCDTFNGRCFFGPCRISSIYNNQPRDGDKSFSLLWSTINGLERMWREDMSRYGPVLYPYHVDTLRLREQSQVWLIDITGDVNITSMFRSLDLTTAYNTYYRRHPIMISRVKNTIHFHVRKEWCHSDTYFIQICLLNFLGRPSDVYRRVVDVNLCDQKAILQIEPFCSISFLCMDLTNRNFWVQVIPRP